MPEAEIARAVQLLDLMLDFFAYDGRWTRGSYDDGNGGHCLVGALLHLGRKHRLPTAPAIVLLQDAMPRPGLPLVHFNDTRCASVAELRSIIRKARRLACRSPIETSPASPIEMSRSLVCLRLVEVAWDDGDHDEPQRADAPAGADRHC